MRIPASLSAPFSRKIRAGGRYSRSDSLRTSCRVFPGAPGTVPSVLGRAAALHQRERQPGRLVASPHPGAHHAHTGPPLRGSPVGRGKPERPRCPHSLNLSREKEGRGSQRRSPSAPRGYVESFCGFCGHSCTTSRSHPPVIYPAAAVLSLSGPAVPTSLLCSPPAAPQGLAGVASQSCRQRGLLGVGAATGRALRYEHVLGALCCSRGRGHRWPRPGPRKLRGSRSVQMSPARASCSA